MSQIVLVFLLLGMSCAAPLGLYDKAEMEDLWGEDIRRFDQLNRDNPPPRDAILFYGSSSIRLWNDIEEDMAPYPVVRRGYGGASLHDAAYFARRVLHPIDYSALVLFIGNDIWGKPTDKHPAEMQRLTEMIVKVSRRHRPEAPIFLIEVTHIPARAQLIKEWDAANRRLRRYADSQQDIFYIPMRDIYLDEQNQVREELFIEDQIHQNEQGYALWTGRIKEGLKAVLDSR